MNDIKKEIIESAKQILPQVYEDTLKPSAVQIGKAFGTIFGVANTALTPIEIWNEKIRLIKHNNFKQLEHRILSIPEENLVEIPTEIIVPAIRKLEYTPNQDLVNLFLNLLCTAANKDTANYVHPSFVNIISDLSSDEARILNYMKEKGILCTSYLRVREIKNAYTDHFLYTTILDFTDIITLKENSKIYINNLIGLGLIKEFAAPLHKPEYGDLSRYLDKLYQDIKKAEDISISYVQGSLGLTEFGNLFIKCCTAKQN